MRAKKVFALILVLSIILSFPISVKASEWVAVIKDSKDTDCTADIKTVSVKDNGNNWSIKMDSWNNWDLMDCLGTILIFINLSGSKEKADSDYAISIIGLDDFFMARFHDYGTNETIDIDVDFKAKNATGIINISKKLMKVKSSRFSILAYIMYIPRENTYVDAAPDNQQMALYKGTGTPSKAKLSVSTKTISLGEIKKDDSKDTNFKVINEGEGTIEAKLAFSSNIDVSPDSVTLEDYDEQDISISINARNLPAKVYSEVINITSNFGNETVTVNFEVLPEPILKVDVDQIDFGVSFRGERRLEKIRIYNNVKGPIKVNLSTSERWIIIGTNEFESNSEEIVISLNTKNLDSQKYEGKVRINSNGGNATIPILIEIIDSFLLDKTEIDFGEIDMDNPIIEPILYSIKNNTDKDLSIKISPSDEWIGMTNTDLKLEPNENRELKIKLDLDKMKTLNLSYEGTISIISKYDKVDLKIKAYLKQTPPKLLWVTDPPNQESVNEKLITGKTFEKLFTIKNDGSGSMDVVVKLEDSKSDFRLFNAKFSLKKGETSDIKVKFDSTGVKLGNYKNSLILESNGGNLTIPILIEIVPKPEIVIRLVIGFQFAFINGEQIKLDEAPYISSGTTMVPLRFIGEAFKAKIEWQNIGKGRIILSIAKKIIQLDIGDSTAYINGEKNILKAPPEIKGGRTFVPVRFISEGLGAKIEWKAETQQITIFYVLED